MKKLVLLALVVALALVLAPAALAGGGNGNSPGAGGGAVHSHNVKYSLSGTVKAVDTDASSLSVLVNQTNRHTRAYKGDVVTITVTPATILYQRTADGDLVVISFADLKAGDRVSSAGTLDTSGSAAPIFTATRVTLRPPLGTCVNTGS